MTKWMSKLKSHIITMIQKCRLFYEIRVNPLRRLKRKKPTWFGIRKALMGKGAYNTGLKDKNISIEREHHEILGL